MIEFFVPEKQSILVNVFNDSFPAFVLPSGYFNDVVRVEGISLRVHGRGFLSHVELLVNLGDLNVLDQTVVVYHFQIIFLDLKHHSDELIVVHDEVVGLELAYLILVEEAIHDSLVDF